MKQKTATKRIQQLVETLGEHAVLLDLMTCGVAVSTAEKLCRGDYPVTRFNRKTVARLKVFFERHRESA